MNYWEKRQQQLNQELEKDEEKLKKKLSSFYSAEYRKLEKEIAAYYSIYGEDKVIEYRKLMQNLDDADRERLIKRMQDFAQLYPEYADMLPIRESIYKLNRLEGLQMSILMQQLEIGAVDIKTVREHLVRQAVRNANQVAETMGYGKNFYSENSEIIRKIVNAKWYDGKDFSERIWGNVQKLARYLGTDIAAGFARGDSYSKLVSKLRQRFEKVSRNGAYRLIYTEGTFISNEARAVAFEQDTEEYVFRIQHYKARRSGWSDICDDLHEKRFKWSERKPGINFPPMHPWCHCTATPSVTDREKFVEDYEKRHGKGEGEKVSNRLKNKSERDILVSGARIIDTFSKKALQFAKVYYDEIRSFSTDTKKIAQHLGKSEEDIRKIKAYLFEDKSLYDSDIGEWRRFDPDCAIAQSWQRLMTGKDIKPHDRTLIEHELCEMKLKRNNPGISHEEAHARATKKYDYRKESADYYDSLKKYSKNEG